MKETLKNILRFLNIIIIKPDDSDTIKDLKTKFVHNERSFTYGLVKYLIDSLYCHASPGVIETIILELNNLQRNNKLNGNKILNLGGGTGQVSVIYTSLGFDVYNLDIDVNQPDEKNINFNLNQNTPIPFADKTFDIIICQEIIEHVENPWKIFSEARRLLKDEGILIISTPNILSITSKLIFLFTGYFKWFTPRDFSYHVNPIPEWEISLISDKNNFNIYKMQGSGDYYFNRHDASKKQIIRKNESLIFFLKKSQ